MDEASVSGALIIQPGNHGVDHSYVTSILKAHPNKFVGVPNAPPTYIPSELQVQMYAGDRLPYSVRLTSPYLQECCLPTPKKCAHTSSTFSRRATAPVIQE
jgi:hypothetical protein